MSAFLIADVDDIIKYLQVQKAAPFRLLEVAIALKSTASLAAGLPSEDSLDAIALGSQEVKDFARGHHIDVQQIFTSAGYIFLDVAERKTAVDKLLRQYFPAEQISDITELILATSRQDLMQLLTRLNLPDRTRIRVWAGKEPPASTITLPVVFQSLETVLGIQTRSVALYIDFENITISLNEQGYLVELPALIQGMKKRMQYYGQPIHLAAYAPWGQRGSLPPMVDTGGHEISDDIPGRLAVENIDPVFNLPGKNSADLRIAKDLLAESSGANSPEIFIIASGDRDFNDIYHTLRTRGRRVIVWGVQGSTSRVLENNPAITLEYIDDFITFKRHKEFASLYHPAEPEQEKEEDLFRPSQWTGLIVQYDILRLGRGQEPITIALLGQKLVEARDIPDMERGRDLIQQAIGIGIVKRNKDALYLQPDHPMVSRTRLIRDHIIYRVSNTLSVRQWNYVNYGFLLKGLAMDETLKEKGISVDDAWRSEWIDFLVQEGILVRELLPHRHNPDDLVPVIKMSAIAQDLYEDAQAQQVNEQILHDMMYRVVVSVEQFTSFRKFAWCPLGSLHRRLRPYDVGSAFQRSVETLQEYGAISIEEYSNPQSDFTTKGVAIIHDSMRVKKILGERNRFICHLLELYDKRIAITHDSIREAGGYTGDQMALWLSIMELENVINPIAGSQGHYSLFRTHHTVMLVLREENCEELLADKSDSSTS